MKTTRRKFLRSTALGTTGLAAGAGLGFLIFPGCDSMSIEKLDSLRKTARNRKRRIIMNNDGNDVNRAAEIRPINPENLLKQRTLGLLGSHVDSIFYCTGVFNMYYHRGEETELRTRDDPNIKDYLHELYELGTDPLEIMIDFGREKGIEVFWSMRMNDTHDSNPVNFFNFAQWKRDHPHCLVGEYGDKFPYGNNRWSSVNYEMPEVRDKVYNILYDVCSRYDIDGVELDFFRHPVLFKQQMTGDPITQDHCDIMTGFMQQVRDMTNNFGMKREKPFLIAVRLPDSVGYCKAMGIDLIRWLENDLVDIVTGADYFKLEPWENLASLGRRYKVPVYACFEARRIELWASSGHPPLSDEALPIWRGEALNAWNASINGVYTFNRFNPNDPIYREIGDPALLASLEYIDRTVYVNEHSRMGRPETWLKDGDSYVSKNIIIY